MRCIRSNAPHRGKRGTAKVASEVLKKGGEVTSEVWGETRGFDFEGMRFGMKAWRASASDAGEGDAPAVPIVLVHGFAQQASTWNDAVRLLAGAGAECFGFELAGHGAGACSAGGDPAERPDFFDLCFQARALLAFCRVVARDAGVAPVLVGYSMGGRVALQAACLAADDLRDGGDLDRTALRSSAAFAPRGRDRRLDAVAGDLWDGDQFGRISLRSSAAFALCDRTDRLDVTGVGQRDTAATSAGDAVRMPAAVPFSALVLESAGLGPADDAAREALRERNFAWATSGNDFGRAVLPTTRNRSRSLSSRRVPTRCLCGASRFARFASFLGAVSQLAIWRGGLMRSTARSLPTFAQIPRAQFRAALFPLLGTTSTSSSPRRSTRSLEKWSNRALPNLRPHDIPHRGMI